MIIFSTRSLLTEEMPDNPNPVVRNGYADCRGIAVQDYKMAQHENRLPFAGLEARTIFHWRIRGKDCFPFEG